MIPVRLQKKHKGHEFLLALGPGLLCLVVWLAACSNCNDNSICNPNPCREPNKTQCSGSQPGPAVCSCDHGYEDPGDDTCRLLWISMPSGSFMMGSLDDVGYDKEHPQHQVSVPAFDMMRSEVTVAHFRMCVQAGACTAPETGFSCNYDAAGRNEDPVNCLTWDQAGAFCAWAQGRLPSEAEWEYTARSAGQDFIFPWGNTDATCENAIMDHFSAGGPGCGQSRTWTVCSKPTGTSVQGLCDLAGNVDEWVQDWLHDSYALAPADGTAWLEPEGSFRVIRGGSFNGNYDTLRAAYRNHFIPNFNSSSLGFRCAR